MPVVFSNFSPAIPPPAPSGIEAGDIHVATDGNDTTGDGSISNPYATLQRAHDVAVAGDLIYVRGGTYTLTAGISFTRDGTSGNRIRIFNYPNETPIIDAINLIGSARAWRLNGANWWHIKGMEVKNAPSQGMSIDIGSDNIIEFCASHNNARLVTGGDGINITGASSNNLILNCDSYFNHYPPAPGGANGIGVSDCTGTGNIVRGCRVWRNSDDGFDLWDSVPSVTLENCWAWENGYDENLNPTTGNGQGFKLGGEDIGDGGHLIQNCLAWRNRVNGFDENNANIALTLYNNTSWENGTENFSFYNAVANVLKNNLSENPDHVPGDFPAQNVQERNSWNTPPGVTVTAADFVSTDFTANTGARQSDGSLPTSDFLRLASGSDCINAGVDVGIAFLGGAPDLGAYERE